MDQSSDTNKKENTIVVPEEEIVMAIKTEPELVVEHDEEAGNFLFTLEDAEDDEGPSCSKIFKQDPAQTDEPDITEEYMHSSESGADPTQSLLFENYFSIIEEPNLSKSTTKRDKISAKCLICKRVFAGTLRVTSNFVRHLRKHHAEKYSEYEKLKYKAKLISSKQDHFDKLVLTFIVKNLLSVSILESDSFKTLLNYANPKLLVMNRPTFLNLTDTTFEVFKNNFKQVIKNCNYFSSTANVWLTKHRGFLNYTIHWINNTFERKSASLACRQFSNVHMLDDVRRIISEVHEEYGLNEHNLVATSANAGNNFLKVYLDFGIINEENFLSEDVEFVDVDNNSSVYPVRTFEWLLPNHIKCASDSLKLIATADFNKLLQSKNSIYDKHKQILKKCSVLWAKAKRPKNSEKLIALLGCPLKYPKITNWNMLYESIKDLLTHKAKLIELCQQLEIEGLRDKEINYLAEYVNLLTPLAEAIDFLQEESGMMFGYVLPTLATIITKYTRLELWGGSNFLKTMATEMKGLINTRFASYISLGKTNQTAIIASVLCPGVKCLWVKALKPEYNTATEAKVINLAKEAVASISVEVEDHKPPETEVNVSNYFNFSLVEGPKVQPSSIATASETEFLAYLTDTSQSLSMLDKYPIIKKAFLKYNTPMPSSAVVGKLLPYTSVFKADRDDTLSDAYFEKLLLLRINNVL